MLASKICLNVPRVLGCVGYAGCSSHNVQREVERYATCSGAIDAASCIRPPELASCARTYVSSAALRLLGCSELAAGPQTIAIRELVASVDGIWDDALVMASVYRQPALSTGAPPVVIGVQAWHCFGASGS